MGTNNTLDSFEKLMKDIGNQIFLGIKAGTALKALTILLSHTDGNYEKYQIQSEKIFNNIEEKGWLDDHYVITIDSERPEGWEQPTPLTSNGLAYLLFTGQELPLSRGRIKKDIQLTQDDYTIWPSMGIWRDMVASYLDLTPEYKYNFRPDFRGDMYPRSFNSVMSIQTYPGIAINIPQKQIKIYNNVEGSFPYLYLLTGNMKLCPGLY